MADACRDEGPVSEGTNRVEGADNCAAPKDSRCDEQVYDDGRIEYAVELDRGALKLALATAISCAAQSGKSAALFIASVNNLTVINETFGFDVGDEVVAGTARIIRSQLRRCDFLGYYSSNKLCIVLADTDQSAMCVAAEALICAIRSTTIATSACPLSAAIAVGGVTLPTETATVNDALGCALHALDQAKRRHTDSFIAYAPCRTRETKKHRNITIADNIITALDENRMHLVLQPIVSASTGQVELYECLLRMKQRDGTICTAEEFIAVAEQVGLSRLLDRRTLELALALLVKHPKLHLALNVSSLTTSDDDWMASLCMLTEGRRDLLNRLTIEITETSAIQDLDQTAAFVDTLKELGCRVAIDDFGAGYTSFKNLKLLNADVVKIDGTFVRDLANKSSDQVFIRTMVEIANEFDMQTVAEWVGDQRTADILRRTGITYLQGYHFGLPFPAADYAQMATA